MSTLEQLRTASKFPDIDRPILEAAITGDEAAGTAVYRFYRHRITGYLINAGIPPDEVEDCSQDVWEKAFHALHGFTIETDKRFQGWLFTIARGVKVDFYRRMLANEGIVPQQVRLSCTHPFFEPEEAIEIAELYGEIAHQIQELGNPKARVVYNHSSGFSHADSARELGITPGNDRQLFSRGLKKIREKLSDPTI